MTTDSIAFVGAAGGTGTTRLTLECATLLARDGRDVIVLDAAYGTQGLADRTPGRIDPDVTTICLEEAPLEAGLVDRVVDGPGRLAVCPARAPFERLASANTPAAAEAFERLVDQGRRAADHVLVDTPPIASNPAVAAVNAADRLAIVADATRAGDAIARTRDRLADLGVGPAPAVVTRTDAHPDADVTVPEMVADYPTVASDARTRRHIASVVDATMDVQVALEGDRGLRARLPLLH